MKLGGKTALITGGGGGIALACAEKGMKLLFADIDLDHAQGQAMEFGDTDTLESVMSCLANLKQLNTNKSA